ncbi:MAG: hypothetical protein AAGA95_22035 [Pseudomonadota bacterium]
MIVLLHENARLARVYLQALLTAGEPGLHFNSIFEAHTALSEGDTGAEAIVLLGTMNLGNYARALDLVRDKLSALAPVVVIHAPERPAQLHRNELHILPTTCVEQSARVLIDAVRGHEPQYASDSA